ncbi:MAG: hypothetical protein L0Y80_12295 [Ignavibacteriae bacterium]|nr:hypothetical protein [Ignavibacteriota bacterium]
MNRRNIISASIPVAYALILLVLASCQATVPREVVLYYDVPLTCMEAPDIGCGPAAKPILVELQKRNEVREAWLNRTGTVLAVVGNASMIDSAALTETMEQFFKDKNMRATRMTDRDELNMLTPRFREEGKWYRGTLVDLLSVEEGRTIARNALGHIQNARLLSADEAKAIRSDIDSYFEREATAVRAHGERITSDEQWYAEMINILAKHVGNERAETIRKFHEEHMAR